MWEKIKNIISTEEWFRFDSNQALSRVWYVGVKNDSTVVQATMEMYAAGRKIIRPTPQVVGAGTDAWATYRSSDQYRVIRTIIKMPTSDSDELNKLIGIDFRKERIYINGIVLLGNIEVQGDDRFALCATSRAGLGFSVGAATPQPKPATEKQEAALAVAATLPSHEL